MDINAVFPERAWFQGDTISFRIVLTEYDPSVWTITYTLLAMGQDPISFSSVPSDDGAHLMEVDATTTAGWAPGTYYLAATASNALGMRHTLGRVEGTIRPDLSTLTTDPRTPNKIALDDVEAALAAGAGSDVVEYTIAGTAVKKDRMQLLELRAFYLHRVRAEQGKSAIGSILYNL